MWWCSVLLISKDVFENLGKEGFVKSECNESPAEDLKEQEMEVSNSMHLAREKAKIQDYLMMKNMA